jgi:hypothetical protein
MQRQLTWDETATDLDYRFGNGVEVALLWTQETGRVAVAVHDESLGERFEIEVLPGENPLDVFYHPYTYAVPRESVLLQAAGEPVPSPQPRS